MFRFDAYFFDFDGTVGDTEIDIRSSWLSAISELGLPDNHFNAVFRIGPPVPDTAKMLFPDLPKDRSVALQNKYKSYYDEADSYQARPYPGITELFQQLRHAGKKVYIVTNKRYKPLLKLAKKFNVLDCCDGIFSPDILDPENHLRKSDLLALALRVAAVAPEKSLMVGDTEFDAAAAKANNTPFCGVTWGYGSRESLEAIAAEFIISLPAELP